MSDVQLTVVDNGDTQVVAVAGENPAVVITAGEVPAVVSSIPGPQGPAGAVAAAIDGSAALPSIAFASDTDTGLYRVGANQLGVSTGGTQRLVIDANGQIEATSLGTAAAPTWTFVGDPNTGIYSPGADQVAISTNGTGTLYIDASGRIGNGVSSAASLSTVYRSTINGDGSTIVGGLSLRNSGTEILTIGSITAANNTDIEIWNPRNGYLRFATNNTERLRITSAGLVGVGTASPSALLTVGAAYGGTPNPESRTVIQSAGNSYITIGAGTSSQAGLLFADTAANNAGGVLYTHSSDTLEFVTAANPRLTITSAGRVGIGTVSPDSKISIGGTGANRISFSGSTGQQYVGFDASEDVLQVASNTAIKFQTSSSYTERMRITSDAYVRLASGTGGIQFNGDTAAANALDDYEEGTFTPTITGGTTAGTATYSAQVGNYTKIGRQVNFTIYIVWSGGTGTGDLRISGLPFTVANLNSWSVSFGIADNVATAANTVITGYAVQNGGYIAAMNKVVGGGANSPTAYDAAGTLLISGSYAA